METLDRIDRISAMVIAVKYLESANKIITAHNLPVKNDELFALSNLTDEIRVLIENYLDLQSIKE